MRERRNPRGERDVAINKATTAVGVSQATNHGVTPLGRLKKERIQASGGVWRSLVMFPPPKQQRSGSTRSFWTHAFVLVTSVWLCFGGF